MGCGRIFLIFAEQCLETRIQLRLLVFGISRPGELISSTFLFTNLQCSPNILRIPRTKSVLSNCAWIKSSRTIGMESEPDSKVAPATVTRRGKTTCLQAIHSAHRVIQSDPECLPSIHSAQSSLNSLSLSSS